MNILVIGSGGREHALAWKLAQSVRVQKVYVAPGNGGTALDPRLENVSVSSPSELADFAVANDIAITVVGPEAPLAAGIVNIFRERGLKIFGPTKKPPSLKVPRILPRHSWNVTAFRPPGTRLSRIRKKRTGISTGMERLS